MTGFGAAPLSAGPIEASVEIRAVNGRHLKVNVRLPSGLDEAEEPLRRRVADALRRGSIDVSVRVGGGRSAAGELEVDHERLAAVLEAYRAVAEAAGVPADVDLSLLARSDGVLVDRPPALSELVTVADLETAVEAAVAQVVGMREEEGRRLAADFRARLAAIEARLEVVESRAPLRLERERERLAAAVAELVDEPLVDDDRLAREIAILADKWDLGEEIQRTKSHLGAFEDLLSAPGAEPVGKRLGFLGQELLREVNTIGSKANDAAIQHEVVEIKNEIETVREQIENVE